MTAPTTIFRDCSRPSTICANTITFTSITENLDFSTSWGKLTLAVLGTLAKIYIDRLRQEICKGKRTRATKGLHHGSPPLGDCQSCSDTNGPGYCPRHGGSNIQDYTPALSLVPHPIEQEAVHLAFRWYATGQYSDGDVVARLNECVHTLPDGTEIRFCTKGCHERGSPGRFGKDSICEMLPSPLYVGMVPYFGVNEKGQNRKRDNAVALYPGQHEAILTRRPSSGAAGSEP